MEDGHAMVDLRRVLQVEQWVLVVFRTDGNFICLHIEQCFLHVIFATKCSKIPNHFSGFSVFHKREVIKICAQNIVQSETEDNATMIISQKSEQGG